MAITVLAGDFILADQFNALVPLFVQKATTTSRNTTTTVTADPHLALTFAAGTVYDFEFLLFLSSAVDAAGDWKGDLVWTGTARVSTGDFALSNALTTSVEADLAAYGIPMDTASPSGTWGFGVSATTSVAMLTGHIEATTASTLTLHWAQLASNANNTNVLAGSKFIARRRS